jgi:hypothetical protein
MESHPEFARRWADKSQRRLLLIEYMNATHSHLVVLLFPVLAFVSLPLFAHTLILYRLTEAGEDVYVLESRLVQYRTMLQHA